MLIIEGGDGVGKSTLVKQLLALDPGLVQGYREAPDEGIGCSHIGALIDHRGYQIFDRFFASEEIYGRLFRGGSKFSSLEKCMIRLLLKYHRTIVIHCDPPDEVILKYWDASKQLYDDPIRIAQAYRKSISKVFGHEITIIKYDWTNPHAEEHRETIIHRHHRYYFR